MVLLGDDAVTDHTPSYCGNCKIVSEGILRLNREKTLGNPGVFFLF